MRHWSSLQLESFLSCHPKIRIVEINDQKVELAGEYHLKAKHPDGQLIDQSYQLKLVCPREYPKKLPQVFDQAGYFPRSNDFHTYTDGTFCLGSEFKIKSLLHSERSIGSFFEKVVDPFLYAVSHRIEFGNYPYADLAHGEQGLIDDYEEILGLKGKSSVLLALKALGKRKREANKIPCPCGCGLRLGRCDYRFALNQLRCIERRRWFREHLEKSFNSVAHSKREAKATQILEDVKAQRSSISHRL